MMEGGFLGYVSEVTNAQRGCSSRLEITSLISSTILQNGKKLFSKLNHSHIVGLTGHFHSCFGFHIIWNHTDSGIVNQRMDANLLGDDFLNTGINRFWICHIDEKILSESIIWLESHTEIFGFFVSSCRRLHASIARSSERQPNHHRESKN